MAFDFKYCADGNETGITETHILKGSGTPTFTVGDAVELIAVASDTAAVPTAYLELAGAGGQVRGVIVDIVTKDGTTLHAASTSDYDGTWSPSTNTYTTAADNLTDKQVKAIIQVHPWAVYSATPRS